MSEINRRRFLSYAATLPLALYLPLSLAARRLPGKIHELEGEVFINQRAADLNSSLQAGDRLSVAYGGRLVFGRGEDTYLLQEGSSLELASRDNKVISGLRLLTGGLLSVFGKREQLTTIYTRTATIGIRGTGVYLNSQPDNLYFCTCYGKTELHMGRHHESIEASHHQAFNITGKSANSMRMLATEVTGHTDDDLRLLERYAGRKPAFDG
jgi:uncharacterized protein with beta-barrel porin domain